MPPIDLLVSELVQVILPALLAAAVVLLVVLLARGDASAGAVAALVAGGVAGCYSRGLVPLWPERLGWPCLPWVALAAMLVGLVAHSSTVPRLAGWLLRAAAAGHAAWLLVPPGFRGDPAEFAAASAWWIPGFTAVVLAEWLVLERLATIRPGGSMPLATALAFLGAAAILIHAGSALLTDLATVVFASLAGVALVAWWWQGDVSAVMPAVAVTLPGLLLSGQYETFSDVPWRSFALAAVAPLALSPALVLPLSRWRGLFGLLVCLASLLIPVAIAVHWAMDAAGPLQFGED